MSDLLQVADLEKAKLHDTFHSEVITGKAGGLAGGADIDFATNAVTGQVQATMPYILSKIGGVIAFNFAAGGTIELRNEFVQDATFGIWQWIGTLPHVVAPGTDPTLDAMWVQIYTKDHAELSGLNTIGAHDAGAILGGIRVFDSVLSMQTGSIVPFAIGQFLKVQGEDDTSENYIVVNSASDVDLGSGLWAKKLPSITENLNHKGVSAFNYIDAISKKKVTLPDLIEKAKALVTIHDMYVYAKSNILYVGYVMGDLNNVNYLFVVEYRFVTDGDGLLLLLGSSTSPALYDSQDRFLPEFTIDSGSLNTVSAPNSYAPSGSGTVLSGTFTGNAFHFRSLRDSRGGIWLVRLVSSTKVFEKTISVWDKLLSGAKYFTQEVFKDIPYDTYDYTLTFKGDDPNHVPSSGAGTSRGWIFHTPSNPIQQPITRTEYPVINTSTMKWLLPSNTVLDFAFSARKAGTSDTYQWVPQHGGVSGVSANINYKLVIDGSTIGNAAGTVPDIPLHSVKSVEIIQRLSAKNPADTATSLWTHYVNHNLTPDGELSISNRSEFNVDTDIGLGYTGMLAAVTSNHNRVVFNNGQEQSPLLTDGSNVYTPYGWDSVCYGGVFDVAAGTNHGCVATVDWSDAANAFGYYQPENTLRQHWRSSSNITKTYWTSISNATTGSKTGPVVAGTVLKGKIRYFCVGGVRNPNASLKPI